MQWVRLTVELASLVALNAPLNSGLPDVPLDERTQFSKLNTCEAEASELLVFSLTTPLFPGTPRQRLRVRVNGSVLAVLLFWSRRSGWASPPWSMTKSSISMVNRCCPPKMLTLLNVVEVLVRVTPDAQSPPCLYPGR